MKKSISIFLAAFVVFLTMNVVMAADLKEPKIIFEKNEIKDIDILYSMAKNNISDISASNMLNNDMIAAIYDDEGNRANLKSYRTAQILKQQIEKDGSITTEVAETSIIDLNDPVNQNAVTWTPGSGNKTNEDWDTSLSVKAYSTIYYKYVTPSSGGKIGVLLTSATGGWTISDASVSISNRSVTLGCNGGVSAYSGGGTVANQTLQYYPSGNTFSYSTNFTKYVETDAFSTVGCNTQCTLKRGTSSTWTLSSQNRIIM